MEGELTPLQHSEPIVRDMASTSNNYFVESRNVVSMMSHDCSLSRCWVTIYVSQDISQGMSTVESLGGVTVELWGIAT